MQLQVRELEQKLKQVREKAAVDKKKLEDELKEEQWKNNEAKTSLTTVRAGKTNGP
jgi:hypothetical protein